MHSGKGHEHLEGPVCDEGRSGCGCPGLNVMRGALAGGGAQA